MKKGIIFLVLIFVNAQALNAQNLFGNEWIRPEQKYLKLSINQAGIYRITYQDIKNADESFLQTNSAGWQLFFRGKEIAIRIGGRQDGGFSNQNYIEFYGEGNDGSQDSLLYRPQKRLHPYQTLFSEVSAYFLTSSPSTGSKRIPQINISGNGLSPEKFHVEESLQAFTTEYTFNNLKGIEPALQQSYFEPGEGWSGKLLTADSVGVVQFNLTSRVNADWPIRLEGMVNGRDNLAHRMQVQLNTSPQDQVAALNFPGFMSQTFQTTIDPKAIQNEQLTLHFKPEKNSGTNFFSITYVKLFYPQAFDMAGQATKVFYLQANPRQMALLSIRNVPSAAIAYDITDKTNCRYLITQSDNGQARVVVAEMIRNRRVLVTNEILKPLAIQPVRFHLTLSRSIDYLIITHASLKQSAMAYATYRASALGGGHNPTVVEVDSLYDQFNYGERSPLALRRFADFMLANTAVKNMLLIGKACSYPYYIKAAPDDLVPTIGYPGSDILLTAGLKSFPTNTPAIPTGRLSVTTNEQVLAYLAKIKQIETVTPNGLWRKHIVHISGGKSQNEAQNLRIAMNNLGKVYTNGYLGGLVTAFSKSNPYEKIESINLAPLVNDGVSLVTFFGHAGPSITDMNFGFASAPQNGFLNQVYPLMIFNGCGVSEIFSRFNTLSTDWLLAPEKGAALVLAHSYYSYEQSTTRYLTKLYGDLFANATTLGMPFGKVQQQLNAGIEKEGISLQDVSVLLQMVLQGDPALSMYPLPNPDFSVEQKGMYIRSSVAGGTLKNSDSLRVVIPMVNLGKFEPGQIVSLSIKATGKTSTSNVVRFNAFRYRDTLVYTIPKDETLQKIDVLIDPVNQVVELNEANNTATLLVDWAQAGSNSSYPPNLLPDLVSPTLSVFINGTIKENRAIVNTNPRIDIHLLDENPLSPQDVSAIDVYLASCDTCSPQKIPPQLLTIASISPNQLQVTTNLELSAGGVYQLIVFGKDAAGNRTQPPYVLTIKVVGADEPITFQTYPNPATTYARFELNLNVQELPIESRLTIYHTLGVPIFDTIFPVSTGKNLLLWQAKMPGIYPYTLRLIWKGGRVETRTGKVVWQY